MCVCRVVLLLHPATRTVTLYGVLLFCRVSTQGTRTNFSTLVRVFFYAELRFEWGMCWCYPILVVVLSGVVSPWVRRKNGSFGVSGSFVFRRRILFRVPSVLSLC